MKINVEIIDATPEQLVILARALGAKMRKSYSNKSDDAPYGKKKDGTPRKKPGRPAYKFEL